jgi:hydrogenase-4 component F
MWKYVLICSVGIGFAFMGTLLMAAAAARLNLDERQVMLWTTLRSQAAFLDPLLVKTAFLFLLTGYGVKAGLAPLHNWLPDAHSQAPAPVSALFSGFMLNAALYCILRWLPIAESAAGASGWGRELLAFFGLLSVLVAAGFVLFQSNIKRLLAYCSVEHIGIVALGVGLGGSGVFAGLFHAFNHSLAKTLSFCAAGRLGQKAGSHEMERLAGTSTHSPFWGLLLTISFLALIGCAPFAVFFSELLTLKAALEAKAYWTAGLLLVGIGFIFIVMLRRIVELAWGRSAVPAAPDRPGDVTLGWGAKFLLVLLTAFVLLPGLWLPEAARNFLNQAADIVDLSRNPLGGNRP